MHEGVRQQEAGERESNEHGSRLLSDDLSLSARLVES
jgi:hypothetical protein